MRIDRTHRNQGRDESDRRVQHGLGDEVGMRGRRSDPGVAFFEDGCTATDDELSELMAEEFVASAISGEEVREDVRNAVSAEELRGLYVDETDEEEAG